ncbi:SIR2 family NAD-dependent protein deacylase [Rhodohalobacter mucosus]|uniref:protein acetyllysine N-acetyltransferase n=1 Tax=Rhodohalobacter mucosus TaxID=2079485 RepID=A0A316TKQ9_9BACT|nr:NAD-dependent deacylase [Rhodohalobacter mucosus]PWN05127.1 NAD-dependent protein deacylase [Rhodohalobacter mucosus]
MSNVVVLSGAGVSAESGLATFRDSGGLWEGYDVQEVASIRGWNLNKEKVLDFYNMRRKQAAGVRPNKAHKAIAELESKFDVTVVTQNVDDLHEKAGSSSVVHLHGMLKQARSEKDESIIVDIGSNPINPGDKAPDGSQLRPNVVWFGEPVPMMETAAKIVGKADIFIVIGTSLSVYPAASLVSYTRKGIPKFIVDPSTPELYSFDGWTHIRKKGEEGMSELKKQLMNQ